MLLEQEEMEQALNSIGAFQSELNSTLEQVEKNVDELFTSQSHLAPQDADIQREEAYQRANIISHRMEEIEQGLTITLRHLSSSTVQNKSEGSHVVNVLNQHQDAIAALEVAAQTLEKDLSLVGRVLKT